MNYVPRVKAKQIWELGMTEFEKLIHAHVIMAGKPLVVEAWNEHLPHWMFSAEWLASNFADKSESLDTSLEEAIS